MHRGVVRSYLSGNALGRAGNQISVTCKQCSLGNLQHQQLFYHCEACSYDLCQLCMLARCQPPVLKDKMKFKFHNCEMQRIPINRKGWACDTITGEFPGLGKVCESGITGYDQAANFQGYFCSTCNLDICVKCALNGI
jgi:hypothetical protein